MAFRRALETPSCVHAGISTLAPLLAALLVTRAQTAPVLPVACSRRSRVLCAASVPFDLYVSRAPSFDTITRPPSVGLPGFLARVFSGGPTTPIGEDEFHILMRDAPLERKGDNWYWIRRPDGDPWFLAEWKTEGSVLLSTSYSHHRFLRTFADMFDMGLRVAKAVNARLYEEVGEREVTARNVDALLDPKGEYVKLQAGTWRGVIDSFCAELQAPLEYPLGPIDVVSEYLAFHVEAESSIADSTVPALVKESATGVNAENVEGGGWCVRDARGKWLTNVMHRNDGKWQIWPAWGQSPFPSIAKTTLSIAERIHGAAGGDIQFLGHPFDDALRKEVRSRIGGLGVDFFSWVNDAGLWRRAVPKRTP